MIHRGLVRLEHPLEDTDTNCHLQLVADLGLESDQYNYGSLETRSQNKLLPSLLEEDAAVTESVAKPPPPQNQSHLSQFAIRTSNPSPSPCFSCSACPSYHRGDTFFLGIF